MSASKEETKEFYELLDDCFRKYESKFNIIAGDFHGKISGNSGGNLRVGPWMVGTSDSYGNQVIKFVNKRN